MTCGLIVLFGCSRPTTIKDNPSQANLRKIALAYSRAALQNLAAVQNVNELRPMLQEVGNPEEILRSPNDGEEYVIIFGTELPQVATMKHLKEKKQPSTQGMSWAENDIILAYESRGRGGRRYAVTTNGDVLELSDQEFSEARFLGGHQPKAK